MAGLLKPNDAMPEDPAVMAPAEGVEDGEAPNVTPEEQKAYEDFVNTGLELIYPPADSGNEDVNPAILSRLKGEGGEGAQPDAANAGPPQAGPMQAEQPEPDMDQAGGPSDGDADNDPAKYGPIDNLARATVQVVMRVQTAAEQAGQKIGDDIILHGGMAIMEELAEVAQKAKIHDYSEEEMEGALYRALDMYREMGTAAGKIDPAQLKLEFGQILQADKSGGLEQLLPGVNRGGMKGA